VNQADSEGAQPLSPHSWIQNSMNQTFLPTETCLRWTWKERDWDHGMSAILIVKLRSLRNRERGKKGRNRLPAPWFLNQTPRVQGEAITMNMRLCLTIKFGTMTEYEERPIDEPLAILHNNKIEPNMSSALVPESFNFSPPEIGAECTSVSGSSHW
jgi:hypothetical protein